MYCPVCYSSNVASAGHNHGYICLNCDHRFKPNRIPEELRIECAICKRKHFQGSITLINVNNVTYGLCGRCFKYKNKFAEKK